ncbi:ATP-binding protein [Streptomyces sp. KLOTTS4A1]|uniref:ATP-binding protein n=1 Tax=Streptomyces sp. KLOTTS4A1 TaxID=3390996 RepID=UPI0039F57472
MNLEISSDASKLTFAQRFSATPRGARLARRLAVQQLDDWGIPHGEEGSERVAVVVGELAANAVTHGRVPGRDFEVRLEMDGGGRLRVEVSDTGSGRPHARPDAPLAERGRGLRLVGALADEWGVRERVGGVGKTVWATVSVGWAGARS